MNPMYSLPSFNYCQYVASFVLPISLTPCHFEVNSSYHFIHRYVSKNTPFNLNKISSPTAAVLSYAYCLEGRHYNSDY